MANTDDADVREAAREVLRLDSEGDWEEALASAVQLAHDHRRSALVHVLAGHLHYAAAIRARTAAGWDEQQLLEVGSDVAEAEVHLICARNELSFAALLVPYCVEIANALADALADSMMYDEAEIEYRRALNISLPIDPALNNLAYDLDPSSLNERVHEVMEQARLGYDLLKKRLISVEAKKVLDVGKRDGAVVARWRAKLTAQRFPDSPRAQYLVMYMDLESVHSLHPAVDKREVLRQRTLILAEKAANTFPNSVVIACFRAKLHFVLGEYDAAERECSRALDMENPNDPGEDCIPPGSVSGASLGERLLALKGEFHELNLKIVKVAKDYWESMTTERRHDFLSIRVDVLQEEINKIDKTYDFVLADVQDFLRRHRSWWFLACPICQRGEYANADLLLSHMCRKHAMAVLEMLPSILDPNVTREIDDSLDELIFCQDSEKNVIICLKERNDIFEWLFYEPLSGARAIPFAEIRENKCSNGTVILENIIRKLRTLPADKSSQKFSEILPQIRNLWLTFVHASVVDYREVILTLARASLWRKLKKCMSEDPVVATKKISAADIVAIPSNLGNSKEALMLASQGTTEFGSHLEDQPAIVKKTKSASSSDCSGSTKDSWTDEGYGDWADEDSLLEPDLGNKDWVNCSDEFREAANNAIMAVESTAGVWPARLLTEDYPDSPLAHCILGDGCRKLELYPEAYTHLSHAAELAQHCPGISFHLGYLLHDMGLYHNAVEVCNHALSDPEPTDPALHSPYLREVVDSICDITDKQFRIRIAQEEILWLRAKAQSLTPTV